MALTQTQVSELYVSIFGRASENEGNVAWQAWTNQATAATDMLNTSAASDYFGDALNSNQAFVEHIYLNTLGKTADEDAAGIAAWVAFLNNGGDRGLTIQLMIEATMLPANNGSNAQNQFINRVEVSDYYANSEVNNDMTISANLINGTDHTSSSLEQAKNDIDTFKDIFNKEYMLHTLSNDNDTFNGTDSNDWIYAGAGNDSVFTGDGYNMTYGEAGDDQIYGGNSQDYIYGGDDNDIIYGGDEVDILYGDSGDDSINGDDGDDYLYGGNGDDYLYGGIGNNTLWGGDGNDSITGDIGDDFVYGESGNDWIDVSDGANWADGGSGNDTIFGGSGIDQLFGGDNDDTIYGLGANDILDGMNGKDTIYGGLGDDTISGNEENDILYGNAGNDYIKGESGEDELYGGAGADILSGSTGDDTFFFSLGDSTTTTMDTITDFSFSTSGADKLKFEDLGNEIILPDSIDTNTATSLDTALALVTTAGDSDGVNALISWFIFEDNTYIYEDMTVGAYSSTTDIIVKLQGIIDLHGLDSDSFIF